MPSISRQTPPRQRTIAPAPTDGILGGGVAASSLVGSKINAAVYGRNGVGKTTFACQGEGPIALLAIDPSPTGGARSVLRDDVVVYQVAAKYLTDRAGNTERVRGSEKILAIVDAIRRSMIWSAPVCPFKRVVVDGLNSWFEIILSEVMCVDYQSMPAVLSKGKVSTDQYVERTERLIRYLRPIVDLPCDVYILAQEKDHNPPKNDKGLVIGSKLMREVAPAQEGSFFSLAISDEACRWVQNACDFVVQLYEDNEYKEDRLPDVVFNGQLVPGQTQLVPTGRRVKRLRCTYHPNYAARFRGDYRNIPEYIEAPTPEDRHEAFMDAVNGRRSKWGYYLHPAPRGN